MKKSGNAYKAAKVYKRPPKVKMTTNKKLMSRMLTRLKPGSKKR